RLGVEQKGSDVVLQRALAPALIVHEKWLSIPQHHIAGLEGAIQKIVARRTQQERRQAPEIVFQCLLIEGNPRQAKKVILEIVQIPGDRLAIETVPRITHTVIQVPSRFYLETR